MNHKYWLLLSLAPFAPVLSGACSAPFHSCYERRNCAHGGANAGEAGNSAGEAGERDSDAKGGTAGVGGADETNGGVAGETDGNAGEGGEGGEGACKVGQQDCSNNGVRTCDANGQYGAASKCTNQTCVVSGHAASCVGKCEPGQTQCLGNGIQLCGADGTWNDATPCPATTPVCAANTCRAPVSCSGLAANCGTANESCCTSPLVRGGRFNRDNDANYPATVSTFRLDKYEVTVGRFRKFVAGVIGGWLPPAGAGKHVHLNGGAGLKSSAAAGYETGWEPDASDWSTDQLPMNKAAWDSALGANSTYATWTSSIGSNETRPINNVSWYQAVAFCIWDGGFLPSEAEWNYAAVGGTAQRPYPWGATTPGMNGNLVVYGCYLLGHGTCSGVTDIAPVGSSPMGNGLFGQADLAGNVEEYNFDEMSDYTPTCENCAYVAALNIRSRRGGGYDSPLADVASSWRNGFPPTWAITQLGLRCARVP